MSWVRNLKRSYADFIVDIPQWEILDRGVTALVGASGSGKTTLLRILLGLEGVDPRSDWSWDFAGANLADLSGPERRIGVVFQTYELFPHMSARQNILFAAESRKRPRTESVQHLDSLCQMLSLERCIDTSASVLSGGEKSRVALARAVIGRPRILFLDEPFSALDPELRAQARKLVSSVIEVEKIPAVLITHDQEDLRPFSGKMTEMKQGKIVVERAMTAQT